MNIEEAFAKLCADHDLTSVAVGLNLKQIGEFRWGCTMHYDGYNSSGIPCSAEHASTPQEAIMKTLAAARVERTPPLMAEDLGELTLESDI